MVGFNPARLGQLAKGVGRIPAQTKAAHNLKTESAVAAISKNSPDVITARQRLFMKANHKLAH
jgi:hypothetical protein